MSGIVGSKFNDRVSGLVGSLGTDGQHMLSSGAGKKMVFETVTAATYDDEPLKSDITALAIREATNESSAAFNLPGSFIESFQDDTNLGTQTTGDRTSGYWSTSYTATLTPDSGDWTGDTGSYTIGTGSVQCTSGNDTLRYDGTFTGDVTVQFTVAFTSGGWTIGFYEADEDGTYASETRAGMESMTDSWYYAAGYGARSYYGSTQVSHDAGLPATTSVVVLKRIGSTITFLDDASTIHAWSQTSANPLRFVISHDTNLSTMSSMTIVAANQISATGTLIQSANSVTGSRTEVGGTMLYADNEGTATLGTDLKIYFTCDGGSNWTETDTYTAITPVYASGIKQVRLGKVTCTGGTDVRYKAVFANQSSGSKETRLHAIGINY
jgi:hypothetical protein